MPFDPTGHGLLSADAAALTAAQLAAQARLAEDLLGVTPAAFDALAGGSDAQRAWGEMVVLQLNYQLERNEALVQQAIGDLQRTYRREEAVSPSARALCTRYFARGETEEGALDVDGGAFFLDAIVDEDEP